MKLDKIDKQILTLIQRDAGLSVGALAELVNISKSACWRRMQKFEQEGIIKQRTTVLDPKKLGLKLVVFISLKTNKHSQQWSEKFKHTVELIPEVMEVHRMGGDVDYLVKAIVEDISDYDNLYQKLIKTELLEVTAGFVMETIKNTVELPIQ